jgi:hypothetical protein
MFEPRDRRRNGGRETLEKPDFIERKMPPTAPRPTLQVPAAPAHTPSPKKPAAVQASLPLADPSSTVTKPKEAFVWDESKGIE